MKSERKEKCEACGSQVESYNTIFLSLERGPKCVCMPCFNKKMSEAVGVDYDHMELQPIVLKDADGVDHEFHFVTRLLGDILTVEAFELIDNQPGGYEFRTGGDVEDGLFIVFSELYERMVRALRRKHVHISKETGAWQIKRGDDGQDIVRFQISCDIDAEDSLDTPLMIVDGKEISWKDFGRMLMTYEGFNCKLQIFDPNDEMD